MLPPHIHDFLQRYDGNTFTEEEHRQFLDWLRTASTGEVEEIADQYRSLIEEKAPLENTSYPGLATGIETALDEVDLNRTKRIPLYKRTWFRVAAAILAIVSVSGLYFVLTQKGQYPAVAKKETKAPAGDVLPGSNKAVLVKSDGSEVVLEDANNQTIREKNGQEIANKNGALSYNTVNPVPVDKIMYNTVRVPRKGQYQLVLADGTKVWLNAESSLTYPTAFNGNERIVEITGEGYFEVAKNAEKPFHVIHDKIDVQVLGTHFNVNSYTDEKEAKITLLEGAVAVSTSPSTGSEVQLKPGQQARLGTNGKLRVLDDADIEEVMAWKEGRFQFKDADLKSIMRQLMRWYDIDVEYKGNIEDRFFTADISRNKNLSSVVKILELSNIHCTIEGRTLIVRP
ncbi:MAG TPA: FecR domain-containing protein [Puia sp.]|nr:FecR domain-containing protein [Puia sp.]